MRRGWCWKSMHVAYKWRRWRERMSMSVVDKRKGFCLYSMPFLSLYFFADGFTGTVSFLSRWTLSVTHSMRDLFTNKSKGGQRRGKREKMPRVWRQWKEREGATSTFYSLQRKWRPTTRMKSQRRWNLSFHFLHKTLFLSLLVQKCYAKNDTHAKNTQSNMSVYFCLIWDDRKTYYAMKNNRCSLRLVKSNEGRGMKREGRQETL